MNTDNETQRPSMNDEPDQFTASMPICPRKNVQCEYWTENGCSKPGRWQTDEPEKA